MFENNKRAMEKFKKRNVAVLEFYFILFAKFSVVESWRNFRLKYQNIKQQKQIPLKYFNIMNLRIVDR